MNVLAPPAGAELTVLRAGATANLVNPIDILANTQATIPVFDIGAIVDTPWHDFLYVDGGMAHVLHVDTIDSAQLTITVSNSDPQGYTFHLEKNSRLTPAGFSPGVPARAYSNPVGSGNQLLMPLIADANGRVQAYVANYRYDYIVYVAGDGAEYRVYPDCVGSFVLRT